MTILIPDELHRQIKERSFREGITMTKIIINAVMKAGEKPRPVETEKVTPPAPDKKVPMPVSSGPDIDETGLIMTNGIKFFLKIPASVVDRLGLAAGHRLYFRQMISTAAKQKFIEASTGSKSGLAGDVMADKDGTLSISADTEIAEKLGFDRPGDSISWRVSGAMIRLYIVDTA